jgi:beta-barrel assembly-enhancing protease
MLLLNPSNMSARTRKKVMRLLTMRWARIVALAFGLSGLLSSVALAQQATSAPTGQDEEKQMGAQLFDQLKSEGEIVSKSPLYEVLAPLSSSITKAVEPKYGHPIHFYIVHETQPNAFAAPGGNIYVTDSLFYFVKNTQELAGTICHETSHLLHHDSMALLKQDQEIRTRAIGATILLGPTLKTILLATAIGQLDSLHYSREAEEQADLTGSDTCATAGYNPWGLVWLFKDFSNADIQQPPEILSNHPDFGHRIAALKQHFKQDPARFAGFNSNESSATPVRLPKSEAEQFLR